MSKVEVDRWRRSRLNFEMKSSTKNGFSQRSAFTNIDRLAILNRVKGELRKTLSVAKSLSGEQDAAKALYHGQRKS